MTMRPDPSRLALALSLALGSTSAAACGESDPDDAAASLTDTDAGESTQDGDDSPQSTTPDDSDDSGGDGDDDDDGSGEAGSTDPDTGDDADTSSDTGAPVDQLPPGTADALLPWLQDNRYAAWSAESGVHPSAGPHGGVRTFVNDALFDSLAAGDATHPEGAAAVKELYSGDAINGWAVMLKVTPEAGGSSWYWYEIIGANVVADGIDVGLCSGCHSSATDYVLTPFPLQ